MTTQKAMRAVVDHFITATNAFDFETALGLFASDAVIEDPSVGDSFAGRDRILDYLERFFRGYHTTSRLLSTAFPEPNRVQARVDFTGDFGHEIGMLDMRLDADGLIVRIDADLE